MRAFSETSEIGDYARLGPENVDIARLKDGPCL
jgi:hypothetical protein